MVLSFYNDNVAFEVADFVDQQINVSWTGMEFSSCPFTRGDRFFDQVNGFRSQVARLAICRIIGS